MDFDMYQTEVRTTREYETKDRLLMLAALGIAGEGGEVVDLIKKAEFHDHPLDQKKVAEELGDLLWYLSTMADAIGWTLDQVAAFNVEKLRARYPDGFDPERSKNRSGNLYLDSLCGAETINEDGTAFVVCIDDGIDGGRCEKHSEADVVQANFEVTDATPPAKCDECGGTGQGNEVDIGVGVMHEPCGKCGGDGKAVDVASDE